MEGNPVRFDGLFASISHRLRAPRTEGNATAVRKRLQELLELTKLTSPDIPASNKPGEGPDRLRGKDKPNR